MANPTEKKPNTQPDKKTPASPAKTTPVKAAPKKPARMIYLGPSLADHSLKHGQVFIGDLPAHLKHEQIKGLTVPLADLLQAKRDLKKPASPLAKAVRGFVDPTVREVK